MLIQIHITSTEATRRLERWGDRVLETILAVRLRRVQFMEIIFSFRFWVDRAVVVLHQEVVQVVAGRF